MSERQNRQRRRHRWRQQGRLTVRVITGRGQRAQRRRGVRSVQERMPGQRHGQRGTRFRDTHTSVRPQVLEQLLRAGEPLTTIRRIPGNPIAHVRQMRSGRKNGQLSMSVRRSRRVMPKITLRFRRYVIALRTTRRARSRRLPSPGTQQMRAHAAAGTVRVPARRNQICPWSLHASSVTQVRVQTSGGLQGVMRHQTAGHEVHREAGRWISAEERRRRRQRARFKGAQRQVFDHGRVRAR